MKIVNETKNSVLSEEVLMLKTLAEKASGLIDVDGPKAAFFKTRFGIHTFGMVRPLDCLVLDSDGRVKRIRESLQPNQMFFWPPVWSGVVELPAGTIAATRTEIGDRIAIV